jgi:hypothetical protein
MAAVDPSLNLNLDHVSVQTPDLGATVELLRDRLGLITTPTSAAADRHGRLLLHRSYMEVAAGTTASLPLFFLRYDRLEHALATLEKRGLRARASSYQGVDGTWEDVELDAGTAVPLPFLVRRVTPPDVAKDWPPPLTAPHPCGAMALASVHVRARQLEPAMEVYERLLGAPARGLDTRGARFRVGSGQIVVHEAAERAPAIVALELQVASLEHTQRYLTALGTTPLRAGDTLWTDLPIGFQLGFCEAPSAAASPLPPLTA